jgi:sialate O-acetylesterase
MLCRRSLAWFAALLLVSTGGLHAALAEVRLPHVIGNDMVLQRDLPLPIWGWADPGEKVTVQLGPNTVAATADEKGNWRVKLPALPAGGPHELTVNGKNTLKLSGILVGEVWLCSGQSNMEMGVGMVQNAKAEIAAADFPQIRLFCVPHRPSGLPVPDVDAAWKPCTPQTIAQVGWGGFSAAAYFFGRALHRELNVPIGLIESSWGGTLIEPWTPPEGFAGVPALKPFVAAIEKANADYRQALPPALDALEGWIKTNRQALAEAGPLPPTLGLPGHPLSSEGRPTGLYYGMIHPLAPIAIRGAIWYQGESNAMSHDGMAYFDKMKALIGGWRQVWGQGDFPFYYVQLAPYRYNCPATYLPEAWEAQVAALSIPNTGMIVTTDITDLGDIHPKNKVDVGKRLALWALAKAYGKTDIAYSGPLYKSMQVEGNKIRLSFEYTTGGLASRDGQPLTWFEIAGEDRKFAKAQAEIDGDAVVVFSPDVAKPVAVRLGWSQEAMPNLMNKAGLPASPFRTDKW